MGYWVKLYRRARTRPFSRSRSPSFPDLIARFAIPYFLSSLLVSFSCLSTGLASFLFPSRPTQHRIAFALPVCVLHVQPSAQR
ncbi:hypothetical protein M747DRAFT_56677 [Aspergillus niger ATCC 13496]|uniref:Uncharacterized protein n=1 Tax=Aspergillus niger ATCC 13496 TaxID=1353008 RepID=A0A370CCI7_ASPNG|nr:hypothetical protein M747DRAFT_56677 [Aspergillus niger ATCC 13496]